ncbi:MAG TPA: CpsD/CapB family tyrosine-protein kinase [Candidatus Acidoferrales bacterium]|nr:CpsD/CapB family tyrosine-protein kinase [Candidatus Acidoferrales bacterium]
MSRIHEALKRAEREKGRAPAQEPEPAPAAAAPAAAPAAPARPLESPTAATVITRIETPAVPAAPARPAAPSPSRPALPALLEGCRQTRWQSDASKLFFLNGKNQTFATEQLRMLRSRLYQERERRALKIVLVTSAMPGEGKTFICANLAHAIARQQEKRVLLVDCDLRSPSLHVILGAPGEPGLAAYLKEEAGVEQILQRGPQENLFLIPGGGGAANPAELVARGRLKSMLSQLTPHFDWVLVDSPAAGPMADALTIADCCDGVLLVVQGGNTPYDVAQGVVQELREKRLLGVVLNRANPVHGSASRFASQ